jgi:hypothetical protein
VAELLYAFFLLDSCLPSALFYASNFGWVRRSDHVFDSFDMRPDWVIKPGFLFCN